MHGEELWEQRTTGAGSCSPNPAVISLGGPDVLILLQTSASSSKGRRSERTSNENYNKTQKC